MEIMYKAFRRIDGKTLMSVYANTKYKVGKVNILKYPAFVDDNPSSLEELYGNSGVSIWKVLADDKVELPAYILIPIGGLTPKKICDFWNVKIPGRMSHPHLYGYRRIKPILEIARF